MKPWPRKLYSLAAGDGRWTDAGCRGLPAAPRGAGGRRRPERRTLSGVESGLWPMPLYARRGSTTSRPPCLRRRCPPRHTPRSIEIIPLGVCVCLCVCVCVRIFCLCLRMSAHVCKCMTMFHVLSVSFDCWHFASKVSGPHDPSRGARTGALLIASLGADHPLESALACAELLPHRPVPAAAALLGGNRARVLVAAAMEEVSTAAASGRPSSTMPAGSLPYDDGVPSHLASRRNPPFLTVPIGCSRTQRRAGTGCNIKCNHLT